MIPYGRQDITQEDIDAIVEVLRSEFLTQGPTVPGFEAALARHVGAKHAVAFSSATAALHVACAALGLGPGDTLWTSPISFVASANCGLYCGAKVDFVDIDQSTFNMSIAALEEKLVKAEKNGTLPKVVIPVHLAGHSCDMRSVKKLSDKYGFKIIEDASHAIGGKYQGSYVGSCQYSDITVFSFHPVKIVTTGEGGMAMTNSQDLADRMALLRSHGITRDESLMIGEVDGPWYYQQVELGYNYRITDIQAALGLSQLSRLEEYVSKRHEIAAHYDAAFTGTSIKLQVQPDHSYSSYHLYIIRVSGERRREIFEKLRQSGVGVNVHYIPIHLQPYYQKLGFNRGNYPVAESYYSEAISLPMFPTLTSKDQDYVIDTLNRLI